MEHKTLQTILEESMTPEEKKRFEKEWEQQPSNRKKLTAFNTIRFMRKIKLSKNTKKLIAIKWKEAIKK